MLISSSKCNWSSSFQTSLYLAAKTGHLHVVKYLLSLNVVDTCIPCLDKINWIPNGKVRFQSKIPNKKLPYEWDYRNFVLKDDRRFLFCESALDIAVQNQHLEIVKVLTSETVNALKCVNARGMTPLITAAAFERNDIVLYFLEKRLSLNDTCKIPKKTRFYNSNIDNFYHPRFCVKGLTFWHILAIYASEETMESVYKQNEFNYAWNITDNYGATPFHYLCCNARFSDVKYIQYFDLLYSHLLLRAVNGSTPAHSAALCGQYVTLLIFIKRYELPKDIKDNSNKNILHYLAMSDLKNIRGDHILVIFNNSYDHLLGEQDFDGRTPLHYAALSGKTFTYNINYWTISHKPQLYMVRDKTNMTVLDVLFRSMPALKPKFGRYLIKLPYECKSSDLFKIPGCSNSRLLLLDNFELFAFQAFSNLKDTYLIQKKSIFTFMRVSLKKNRFYLIFMIKEFFPKFYKLVSKKNVHWFLAQFLKKSVNPNLTLAAPFFTDLIKLSCTSKQQDGSLWYIFYDKHRKFWPIYLGADDTNIRKTVDIAFQECNQRDLFRAATMGGNYGVTSLTNFRDIPSFDVKVAIYEAPCVVASSKFLMPKQVIEIYDQRLELGEILPYSHPSVWRSLSLPSYIDTVYCFNNRTGLNSQHIAAAKGFFPIFPGGACHNKFSVTPHMLAYFFNHSVPYEENINKNIFFSNHFVSLYLKTIMDFHTFVFPKNSAAWKCFPYTHKINRMSLKKFTCRANLEKEICNLISKLYAMDWHLIYHMYSFSKIKKYVDHEWKHPFDFISFMQLVRTRCDVQETCHFSSFMQYYYKAQNKIKSSCSFPVELKQSKFCLKSISFLNIQRKNVNFQIQTILQMYFPLAYLIYDKFIVRLPDLAHKNTMEIIQIMHAYGSAPFFHNHPLYDYWNELNSSFSNPFRTMTQSILSSNLSEISSWIREENYVDRSTIEALEHEKIHFNPLTVYNLTKHDSSN